MNKNIKLLIENIFQREGARELLKKSKAEELDAQIRKMYLYHPTTKNELIDNIIECLENKTDLNLIDVSEITDFTLLFNCLSKINRYIQKQNITSIDISGWYIRSDANIKDMFKWSTLEEIVLPNNLHKIDNEMFFNSNLKSVTIPNSVTSIGCRAFCGCTGLTSVTIPNSVTTIGKLVFSGCSRLTSVTIPDSVTYINNYAFYNCPKLTIYVNNVAEFKSKFNNISSPIKSIKEKPINENIFQREGARELLKRSKAEELDAQIRKMYLYHPTTKDELKNNIIECFKNKTNLNSIDVSEIDDFEGLFSCNTQLYSKIGEYIKDKEITSIDISGWYIRSDANVEDMFKCSTLKEIVLPNNLQKIDNNMFWSSHLKSVTIPDSVTSIGSGAFYGCSGLTSITIPDSVTSIGGYAFNDTPWFNNQPDGFVYAGLVAYQYKGTMPSSTSIVIKNGTLGIAGGCFFGCWGLTSVTIPNSIISIGDYAFYGCRGLTSVTIPNKVTSIGKDAFKNCPILTIYVNNVAKFKSKFKNYRKFCKASQIKSIRNKPINENIFQREGARELLKKSKAEELDNQIRKMYLYHPTTKDELIDNIIECLKNETDLNSIDVSEITDFVGLFSKIGIYIIDNGITSIDISGWYIRSNANIEKMFKFSTLEEIVLPNNLHKIEVCMFYCASKLTSVIIPNSVTSIGNGAFWGCSGLKSVTIPNSVTKIGWSAFEETPWFNNQPDGLVYAGLVAYKYKGTMPDGTSIVIKNGTLGIAGSCFYGCSYLTSVTIPNSVTSIGEEAFAYCSGLKSVTIPNSVTSIGFKAFKDCSGLTSVTISDSVTYINNYAFSNCHKLTIYVNNVAEFKSKVKRTFNCSSLPIKSIKEKPINENIFQRKDAREFLKKTKLMLRNAEKFDDDIWIVKKERVKKHSDSRLYKFLCILYRDIL